MSGPVLHALDHSLPEVSGYSVRSHHLLRAQRVCGIDAIGVARSSRVATRTEGNIDGVPYVWLPSPARGPATPLAAAARILSLARQLQREADRRRAALLHAHSPALNGAAAWWVARRRGLPFVYEMRALWELAAVERGVATAGALRQRAAHALETRLLRRAAAVVVISAGLRDEVLRRGVASTRIHQVPNGVDTEAFEPRPRDADLASRHGLGDGVVFGYLGFFFAYEGVDVLLRAFAAVSTALPGARLLLVGGGDEDAGLRRLAADVGVAGRVIFAGEVPRDDVRRWYSLCDVLVYPRRRSRLTDLVTPLKPLEAMAMGKPVVAADVGGLRELVRDGETGLLCAPDDVAALAACLADLGAAPTRREALGGNARRFVRAERDWSRLAPIYDGLYRELTGSRQGREG